MTCTLCGCKGLHACIGHEVPPATEEQKQDLKEFLDQFHYNRLGKESDVIEELTKEQLDTVRATSGCDQSLCQNIEPF